MFFIYFKDGEVRQMAVTYPGKDKNKFPRTLLLWATACASKVLSARAVGGYYAIRFSGGWQLLHVSHPSAVRELPSQEAAEMWLMYRAGQEKTDG